MRTLALDYGRKPAGAGAAVLLVGAALAIAVAFDLHALRNDERTAEARLVELGRSAKSADNIKPVRESSSQDVALANGVLQRLALPWDDLFAAIESVRGRNVALLSIEPDAARTTVKIGAEAKSTGDMLEYVRELQGATGLGEVTLSSHHVRNDDPQRAVRFVVLANWTTRP
jgi:hypothetical protein